MCLQYTIVVKYRLFAAFLLVFCWYDHPTVMRAFRLNVLCHVVVCVQSSTGWFTHWNVRFGLGLPVSDHDDGASWWLIRDKQVCTHQGDDSPIGESSPWWVHTCLSLINHHDAPSSWSETGRPRPKRTFQCVNHPVLDWTHTTTWHNTFKRNARITVGWSYQQKTRRNAANRRYLTTMVYCKHTK